MSVAILPAPTWFVGCGNMAGAMVEGWRSAEVDLAAAVAIRPSGRPVAGVRTVNSLEKAGAAPRLVILGFKPQTLDEVAPQLAPRVTRDTIVVSLLAGVELASLRERFPNAGPIVRAIPNLPVSVRRGVIALYSEVLDDAGTRQLTQIFAILGFALWTASEEELAAVGAVAGAGPAYVARFIAAFSKAGVQRGLDQELAELVALETVLGTAWMATASRDTMESIAKRVASPKGTTEAGLAVLDHDAVLDQLIALAISAAARRGEEMAQEARSAPQVDSVQPLP